MKINSAFKIGVSVTTILALCAIITDQEKQIKDLEKKLDGARSTTNILKRVLIQSVDDMDEEQAKALMHHYNTELKFENITRNMS